MIDPVKSIHIRRISSSEDFYALNDRWNALLTISSADSFFLRWEWLWTWWNIYKEEFYRLCILLSYKSNELVGIAPFYVKTGKSLGNIFNVKSLMFLGTTEGSLVSEYMDIICKYGEEDYVVQNIIEYVVSNKLCDDISLHKIETSSKTILLLKELAQRKNLFCIMADKWECPYINLPHSWEELLGNMSGTLRYNIRKNRKNLMRHEGVIFRKTDDEITFAEDFKELVRLHQIRWGSRQMSGSFSSGKFPVFQKTVMEEMLKNGHLGLWFLSVSKRNIAALYNIQYKNKIYFYQGGIDVDFDKNLSPGLLLHSFCIEDATRSKYREYDFLLMGNGDAYKKRWTKDSRYMCDIYIALAGHIKLLMSTRHKISDLYGFVRKKEIEDSL